MLSADHGGLSADELREASRLNPWMTGARLVYIYAALGGLFTMAIIGPWWVTVLAIPLVARFQMALGAMMHDGAHRRLTRSRPTNDLISQLLCAGPLFLVADGYRRTHLKHHRKTLADDDPDIGITGGYPISRRRLAKRFARDISGQTYIKFVRHFILPTRRTARVADGVIQKKRARDGVPTRITVAGLLGFHGILLGTLTAVGHVWLYPILWLLPQATVLQVFLRIRGIAEHAGYVEDTDARNNTRTVLSRSQAWWVAPGDLNFHITHHLYPSVPWYRVRHVHQVLRERGALSQALLYPGYGAVLRELTRLPAHQETQSSR